ncbi:MAG: ABC transporter ATP-binding protein [Burkholderiales bacterium]|nr:ABC transporter ATP-binding protein [Burkholderiales bacterium]
MSSEIAIKVESLSKCYHVYDNPHDRLKQFVLPPVQRLAGLSSKQYFREFWALKNISFEVRKGETVGIIGRNGSGKSTLLQLICGTLSPTGGSITTQGRIAALLELGSGFNPEFTGRENVYLNAAVLGLTKEEVDARFDSIVNFAEISDFIDQPVKTYSSGMFVRLAFSVSVHVQPDILIVDEALSVGDIAFRNKCMDAIQKMVAKGVTILFVTHDLGTLQLFCSRVLWLAHGELRASGDPVSISQNYYASTMQGGTSGVQKLVSLPPQQETGKAQFLELHLIGGERDQFVMGQPLRIAFKMRALEDLPRLNFAISVYRADGDWLIGQTSRDEGVSWDAPSAGDISNGYVAFSSLCLAPGDYLVAFAAYSEDYTLCYALTDLCLPFSVRAPFPTWGKIHHPCTWSNEEL